MRKWLDLSLTQRNSLFGYLFIMPFIIGFVFFFLNPVIHSITFSLSELEVTTEGFELEYVGLSNYYYILFGHAEFVRVFVETALATLMDIPAILIFSFFAATLLNQEFRGRILARIIFFLPVILAADVVVRMAQADSMFQMMQSGAAAGGIMEEGAQGLLLSGAAVQTFLLQLRLPEQLIEYVINAVDHLPEIINASAIPILIFLAALQSIPPSLYEASKIEGASGWENFWKITFPLVSPMFLTNIVYIIVDSFTSHQNELVQMIENEAWGRAGYGVSVAMAWFYFAAILIILLATVGVLSSRVVYMD